MSEPDFLIRNQYKMVRLIAALKYFNVYLLKDVNTGEKVAAKMQSVGDSSDKVKNIQHEGSYYQELQGHLGIPFLIWYSKLYLGAENKTRPQWFPSSNRSARLLMIFWLCIKRQHFRWARLVRWESGCCKSCRTCTKKITFISKWTLVALAWASGINQTKSTSMIYIFVRGFAVKPPESTSRAEFTQTYQIQRHSCHFASFLTSPHPEGMILSHWSFAWCIFWKGRSLG